MNKPNELWSSVRKIEFINDHPKHGSGKAYFLRQLALATGLKEYINATNILSTDFPQIIWNLFDDIVIYFTKKRLDNYELKILSNNRLSCIEEDSIRYFSIEGLLEFSRITIRIDALKNRVVFFSNSNTIYFEFNKANKQFVKLDKPIY